MKFPSLSEHKSLLEELLILEEKIKDLELPGRWYYAEEVHKQLVFCEKCMQILEQANHELESDIRYKILKKVSSKLARLQTQLRYQVDTLKKEKHNISALVEKRSQLIEQIHQLIFILQQYPVEHILRKKIFRDILKGLDEKFLVPAKINYFEALKVAGPLINEEIILVLEYNSQEAPLLVITQKNNEPILRILKKGDLKETIIIQKLMELFGLRSLTITTKGYKKQSYHAIEYIKGETFYYFTNFSKEQEEALAYFLGAATADAFVLNLSDRLFNMHIDVKQFNRRWKKPENNLLAKNPIFHIDYEFSHTNSVENYLNTQIFNPFGGIFTNFFLERKKQSLVEAYNKGIADELKLLKKEYQKKQKDIDELIQVCSMPDINTRLAIDIDIFIDCEKESFDNMRKAA